MMRRSGLITGKLGEHYFASVFSGLGSFEVGAGLDRVLFWFVLLHHGEASIHPTGEDLPVGTPGMEPIFSLWVERD